MQLGLQWCFLHAFLLIMAPAGQALPFLGQSVFSISCRHVCDAHRYCKKLGKYLGQQSRSQAEMQPRACSTQLPALRCTNHTPPRPPPPTLHSLPSHCILQWGLDGCLGVPAADLYTAPEVVATTCKRRTLTPLMLDLGTSVFGEARLVASSCSGPARPQLM